jgi:hypothetical protein
LPYVPAGHCYGIKRKLYRAGKLGGVAVPVVEKDIVPVGQPSYGVLMGEPERIPQQLELIVLSS